MRILICNYEYPPLGGGGGVVTALLAQELAKRHEVTVLTSQGMDLPEESTENGVRIIRVPVYFRKQMAAANVPSMLAFIPMGIKVGKKLLREEKFDVINTHFALPSGPVGDSLSRFAGIPNVLSVHGGDLYDPSKITSPHRHFLLRRWIRKLTTNAHSVIGQSVNTIQNLYTYYTAEKPTVRIPLGIQRPDITPAPRSKFGFSDDEIILSTVGRLVGRKANDQLISMMANLKDDRLRLVIMGSGPQQEALKQQAEKLGIADKVNVMGFVPDDEKFEILEMSDLYVSTSQHEGFGLVFLEAMHCGLPVVCYNHGGQNDFLSSDETGYLVQLNDLDMFTDRVRQLADNVDMRNEMGAKNRRAVNEFYIENCARQYEEVFDEAVGLKTTAAV